MFIAPTEMYKFKVFLIFIVLIKNTKDRGLKRSMVIFVYCTENRDGQSYFTYDQGPGPTVQNKEQINTFD